MLKWRSLFSAGKVDPPPSGTPQEAGDFVLDLTDPGTISAFPRISADLRATAPCCPLKTGGVMLLDREDVHAAFTSPAFSNEPSRFAAINAKNRERYTAAAVAANIPPFLDGERHLNVRRWVSRALFDRLKSFEERIAEFAREQLNNHGNSETCLLVEDLARSFVCRTMAEFVGLSGSREDVKRFTAALFSLFAPMRSQEAFVRANQALADARRELLVALEECRAADKNCLLTLLDRLDLPMDIDDTKDLLIVDNALLILADGIENVEAGIGEIVLRWASAPRPIDEGFVRDVLQMSTPGQTIPRIASGELYLKGRKIAGGTPVFLSLASANLASGETDATPTDYSFGMGRHRCLGERLAIGMMLEFTSQLVNRNPVVDAGNLEYAPMFGHRWPRNIEVTYS